MSQPTCAEQLGSWIDDGGVLVRFRRTRGWPPADDDLVPVKLRRGGRILGGSLSWETAATARHIFARQSVQRNAGAQRP